MSRLCVYGIHIKVTHERVKMIIIIVKTNVMIALPAYRAIKHNSLPWSKDVNHAEIWEI